MKDRCDIRHSKKLWRRWKWYVGREVGFFMLLLVKDVVVVVFFIGLSNWLEIELRRRFSHIYKQMEILQSTLTNRLHSIAFWVYWIIHDLVQTLHFYAAYSISSYTITFLMHFFKIMNESLLSGRSLFTHSKWEWRRRNVRFQYRKLCFLFCYLHVVWQVICVMQTINFDGITILLYLLVYLYCTGDKNRICYAKAHTLSKTRKEGNWTESRREIRFVVAVMLHKIQCNVHKSNTTYDFDVRIIIIEWKCFHCIRIEHDR